MLRKALYQCDSSAFLSQKVVAMASLKKVQEMLCLCQIEEITGEEEFVLLSEVNRSSNLKVSFPRRMKSFPSRIKTQPNVKPISEW